MSPEKKSPSSAGLVKLLKACQDYARKVLGDPNKAQKLAADAEKLIKTNNVQFEEVIDDLSALIRMIRAYAKGDYRDVPWTTVLSATAAVVYVLVPTDLIPDIIAGVGFADDVAAVVFVVNAIKKELDAFREWEDEGAPRQGPN